MEPASAIVLALDVGGTSVKAAAFDGDLAVLAEARRPSVTGPAILEVIAAASAEVLQTLSDDQRARVSAAGIAMLGLVDRGRGVVVRSVNLDLDHLDVAGPLSRRWGVPVVVGHDVQAAADAERRASPGGHDDPFVAIIGTGIAGVSFVRGEPIVGVSGQAGELGHVVVRPGGPLCRCGSRGCLEAVASAGAIAREYTERSGRPVDGAMEVLSLVGSDEVAAAVWTEATEALADGLLTVCALTAPGEIVLGGGLAEAGSALVDPVEAAMKERAHVVTVPPVRRATLGSRAGVVGAALLAFDLLEVDA